jgi:hypothetical protein
MTPRERLLETLRQRPHDRVPLALEGFLLARREEVDRIEDGRKREVAERVFKRSHFHVGCNTAVNRYLVTPAQRIREVSRTRRGDDVEVTTEIDTPAGPLTAVTRRDGTTNTWWTTKYPVESLEDIETIRSVPRELPAGVAGPDLSCLPADFERRGIVRASVSSPFVCVAGMMPYQYFLELCATHFELIRELTALCLERILAILNVVLAERTVEYVWMGGSEWLTPPMGSPRLYEALVHEYEKPVIDRIHEGGAFCHVHCHGNTRSTIESVIARGADLFEPVEPPPDGDITMAEAKAVAAGRMVLGGNVEARILENEDAAAVEAATRAAFDGGGEHMALSATAGPIGRMTERMRTNYHRLIDVWEELSPL